MIKAIVTVLDDDKEISKTLIDPYDEYYNPVSMSKEYIFKFVFSKLMKDEFFKE